MGGVIEEKRQPLRRSKICLAAVFALVLLLIISQMVSFELKETLSASRFVVQQICIEDNLLEKIIVNNLYNLQMQVDSLTIVSFLSMPPTYWL